MRGRSMICIVLLICLALGGCGKREPEAVRVGSLKGPTSLGILFMMDRAKQGRTEYAYEFQMATGADELLALLAKGDIDIALIPANTAAILYQKTEGGITVIDINTLGVLYLLTGSPDIADISDLKGRTIYLTGKGTTPEASLKYVLAQNGLTEDDYTLEYKSEAAEVAAVLAQDSAAIGLLPQPFATAALMQNQELQMVFDMNAEWEKLQGESAGTMVTGVTIVRDEFLEEQEEVVEDFLKEHQDSVTSINADPGTGAALAVEAGIVAKEAIAEQAIPQCNLVCITGEEMKGLLSAYLEVLEQFNPELTGGKLPQEDFYY